MQIPRLLIATVFVFVLTLAGCGGESRDGPTAAEGRGGPPPAVTVTPVLEIEVSDEYERVGKIRAIEDVELRARITGFLEQRLFEEGSDVEKGELLFLIERAPYEAHVARAKAELARAKAAREEATLELRRTRQLRRDSVASQADLDSAVASEAETSAEVLAAEAGLTEAMLDLEYTAIHAPVSGRVGRAIYSVGDLVGPESGTLATLASLDPIHAYWQVPEGVILDFRRRSIARARNDQPPEQVKAHLRFGDGSIYEHEGVWDFLDNRIDPTTGTQTARAVFPNPDGLLLPGQYAVVLVQVGEPRTTLAIPQSAVQEDQSGRFVLAVDDQNIARLRRVEMGARRGIYWAVSSGLSAGDRVIYQGIQKVRPDAEVEPDEQMPDPPVGTAAVRAAGPQATGAEGDAPTDGGSRAGS